MRFKRENFIRIRKEQRWSLKALAEEIHSSAQTMHLWENGHHEPPKNKIYQLAIVLRVPVSEIFEIETSTVVSEKNFKESVPAIDFESSGSKTEISEIFSQLGQMISRLENHVKINSFIIDTIIQSTPNPTYIKDTKQNYIAVNKSFLRNISLPDNYKISGKTDSDFFNPLEAKENTVEDEEVVATGKPVKDREGFMPGSKHARWANIIKIPVLDSESRIIGIQGMFIDITSRKKMEKRRLMLENALHIVDEFIWIGKGLKEENGKLVIKKFLYISSGKLKKYFMELCPGLSNELSDNEIGKITRSMFLDRNKVSIFERDLSEFPVSAILKVRIPNAEEPVTLQSRIYYDRENDLFVGMSKVLDPYDQSMPHALSDNDRRLIEKFREHGASNELINNVLKDLNR